MSKHHAKQVPLGITVPVRSDQCFLCGNRFRTGSSSDEHIFPKWLLHEYKLWDQWLTMLNGKRRPFGKIRIPCCIKCNCGPLSRLENKVKNAHAKGYADFKKLPDRTVYLWMLKIIYELLHLEKRTFLDPAKKYIGTTISAAELSAYRSCHIHLQSLLVKTVYSKNQNFSLFRFRMRQHKQNENNFGYRDNFPGLTLAIHFGDVGLIACLEDGGTVRKTLGKYMNRMAKFAMHPIQFRELAAMAAYKSMKLDRVTKYVAIEIGKKRHIRHLPIGGMSSNPLFDHLDDREFAQLLAAFCHVPLNSIFQSGKLIKTFVEDEKGNFRVMTDPDYD